MFPSDTQSADKLTTVSVVVPVKNGIPYLNGAVERLLQQSHPISEILLVIDDSSDESAYEANMLAARHPCVRAITLSRPSGSGVARNEGVRVATGDYVWFVDIDDYWEPQSLELLVDGLRASGWLADVVVGGALVCSADGRQVDAIQVPEAAAISGPRASRMLLTGQLSGHVWNKLLRRSLLLEHPFPPLPTHQDLACLLQLMESASMVTFVQTCRYHYIRRSESTLHSNGRAFGSLLEIADDVDVNYLAGFYATVTHRDVSYFRAVICVLECARDSARLAGVRRRSSGDIVRAQVRVLRSIRLVLALWSINRRKSVEFTVLLIAPRVYMAAYRRMRKTWQTFDTRAPSHEHSEDFK